MVLNSWTQVHSGAAGCQNWISKNGSISCLATKLTSIEIGWALILTYTLISASIFLHCYTCGDRKYRVLVSVVCLSVCLRVLVSVCLSRCLSVCLSVCKHDNSKNKWSRILKFEYIVGYEKSSDEFDIGHCPFKVKVTAWLWIFSHLPQYKLSSAISQLWNKIESCD